MDEPANVDARALGATGTRAPDAMSARGMREVVFFLLMMMAAAAPAVAQTEPAPLPSRAIAGPAPRLLAESPLQQLDALQRWTRDYAAWKAWYMKWRNVREPGFWSTRARREVPEPPAWLPDMCASRVIDTGPLADGCLALADWGADEAAQVFAQQLAQAQTKLETPQKTIWWERIHMDGLWPMTQTGSSALGVVGMHTTMHLSDRLQVFLAPGMIMMRVPSLPDGMTWSAATDWGFSYRLFDVRIPGMGRPSTVHVNIVRVWVLGQHAIQSPGEMYLAGFSISLKKR